MAKAEIQMPEDFLLALSRLGDKTDDIIPRVLAAGGEVVLKQVKGNLQGVIGRGNKEENRSTGQLVGALGVSPAKIDRNGNWDVKIGFAEPRRDGESNAKIANILEYGKSDQPPRPFMKPAKTQSKAAAIEAMKATLEREIDAL
jgi:HK97 gp10 family phage protein